MLTEIVSVKKGKNSHPQETHTYITHIFTRYRYGEVTGVSMHKGYAFIQYACEEEARKAVSGEHLKEYAGQSLGNGPSYSLLRNVVIPLQYHSHRVLIFFID